MPITTSDILRKFSISSASSGNSVSGVPDTSLGNYIATNQITNSGLHNLFDRVTGDENAASDVEYRCMFVHNNHASLTWESVVGWMSSEVSGGASAAIGVDPTTASLINATGIQAVTIADEGSAPSGVTFTTPMIKASGISIGNLQAGYCRAIWVRRTAANTSAKDNDGVTLSFSGDTGE